MRARYVDVPSPPKEKVLDLSRLDGGLNTWELSYRIKPNQSPDMENMWWADGALGSRPGQKLISEAAISTVYSTHVKLFNGKGIIHADTELYSMNTTTGELVQLYTGLTEQGGAFFNFDDKLYYKNGAEYVVIDSTMTATDVVGYEPIIAINRQPDGTGGALNQSENRIAAGKWVHFTSDGTSAKYVLPLTGLDATACVAIVNGTTLAETTNFTVNRTTGEVTFLVIPVVGTTNNVKIKCFKENTVAKAAIMGSRAAINYGSDNDLGVIVGGPSSQPNAYFWSGVSTLADPTYFPIENYNLAGNADEYITGFGKQQRLLIIFKEHSVGKTSFQLTSIGDKDYLQMPYVSVNDNIGCDLPNTIQLVRNNLVFCNTLSGVHMLLDTSNADENSIVGLSRNVNGTSSTPGLLAKIRSVSAISVSSVDDAQRYWLVAAGNAYVWDYTLSPYTGNEEALSWFPFTNINAVAWIKNLENLYYGTSAGQLITFDSAYNDLGEPIVRRFKFATQYFDTYELLKDVLRVIFSVRSDTDTVINITYETDYESRDDLTPIRAYSYKLLPRNLAFRFFGVLKYAKALMRSPMCLHIRHFAMTLTNSEINTDMSLVGAQVVFRYSEGER